MINLTLNKKENSTKDLILFSEVPNIVSISSNNSGGIILLTKANATINVENMAPILSNTETKIIVNGFTISGINDKTKLSNRYFYNNGSEKESCAISIINALKTVPQLSMNYDIIYQSAGIFTIQAKNEGSIYNLTIESENLNNFNVVSNIKGNTSDELYGNYSSKIYLDIYYYNADNIRQIGSTSAQTTYSYLTTLEKEYYRNETNFDITPALSQITNHNNTSVFKINAYAVVDGNYKNIGSITDNYIIDGYRCNNSEPFIDTNTYSTNIPALNMNIGNQKTNFNKDILYIYNPEFVISLYKKYGFTSEQITIYYLNSDESQIFTETKNIVLDSRKNIGTYNIDLNNDYLKQSYFVDLLFYFGKIRLNVINPPNANAECNRIYWYNSYGGVSFFDFVGKKTEERETSIETYNKDNLDYYNNDFENKIIYSKEVNTEVSLETHLIAKDGLYQLYDLLKSKKAWIEKENNKQFILINNLEITEQTNNVFIGKITYEYSVNNN